MQVTSEKLSGLELKLNVEIPVERVNKEVQTKLRKIASTAKMAGFRPGKVPFAVIEKRHAAPVRYEVIEDLVRTTYVEAIQQEKLSPAGMPKFEINSNDPEKPFTYSVTFEIYPEVSLTDINQIQVEKTTAKLTDEDVNEMLEKLRKSHVQWQDITDPSRKSQAGDQLTVDFTAKVLDDPNAEAKSEKGVKFVLGDKSMWDDFEKHLYDLSVGEKKKYSLKFPETHMEKELIGKEAEFEVEVHGLHEPILPALDDEFAKKFNIKEGGIESLKKEVRQNMERELEGSLKNAFKLAITDKLLESNLLELPKVLVENELDQLAKRWQERFAQNQKSSAKIPEFPRADFMKQAQRNVSLALLLAEVIKENKVEVNQQELRAKIEELASSYDDTDKIVDWYFSDQNRLAEIRAMLLEERAIDLLASKVGVTEKEISYKDAVARK